MTNPTEVEILDDTVNAVVARVRGRAFPGVIVQGDTLSSLYRGACRITARAAAEGRADDDAELLRDTLAGLLEVYETVMERHGLGLPYEGRVRS